MAIKDLAAAAAATFGWQTLVNDDLSTLGDADWTGQSSVTLPGGYAIPWSDAGASWTKQGPDGSTGVVLNPSGAGAHNAWFAPTLASLAAHFSLTTHVDDGWACVLSFASLTQAANGTLVQILAGNTAVTEYFRWGYGRPAAASDTLWVDGDGASWAYTSDSAVVANVSTIGMQIVPNGMGALMRYSTSESRDWGTLTAQGSSVAAPAAVDADGEASAMTIDNIGRIGASFSDGTSADKVTLTGLGIYYCPRLGA